MKGHNIRFLFLVLVSVGFPAHAGFAQVAWSDADCYYDDASVNGWGQVSVGYEMGYYYNTSVALVLYDPYDNIVAAETNYTNGYSHAHDWVQFAPATPGTYTVRVYVDAEIYYSDQCGYIDYLGFSDLYLIPEREWYYYEFQGGDPEYCISFCCRELLELLAEGVAPPTVTISSSQSKNDGDNAPFHVTVVAGTFTITGYTWAFTYPSGAGNNPGVVFSAQGQNNTSASCKWFASPNMQCPPPTCTYTIGCTVTFDHYSPIMDNTSLTVSVPWDPAGTINTSNRWNGSYNAPVYDQGRGVWYIPGHTFVRGMPTVQMIMPQSTQFYDKLFAHENAHVQQYGSGGIFGDLWLVQTIWDNTLQNLTAATQSQLSNNADTLYYAWLNTQISTHNTRLPSAELEAWNVSDMIAPFYLWQRVCQQ